MSASGAPFSWLPVLRASTAFGASFACAVVLQAWGGAYRNELGGHPDEAAHYVTGLMVHDYLHELRPLHPLRYAEEYYRHYPKVALGHWPPFFYGLQALWMSVWGTSRTSALLLIATITAALATLCWGVVRPRCGAPAAWALGAVCVAAPLVQAASQSVMADVLVAVLCLLAVIALGRYFDTGRATWSLAFGVVASLALLTKTTGFPLALVPGLSILLGRRWELLRQWSFWLPAAIVGLLCGPWYVLTWRMASNGLNPAGETLLDKAHKLAAIGRDAYAGLGPVLLGLALLGLWRFARRREAIDGVALCVLCLGPAVLIFILLTPLVTEPRYLLGVLPSLLLLAGAGLAELGDWWPPRVSAARPWLAPSLALIAFAGTTFYVPVKTCRGYEQLATFLQARPEYAESLVLINSDTVGEGMGIAELAALRRERPRVVVRASKLLRSSRWDNSDYQLLYGSPGEVQNVLTQAPIGIVVLDHGVPKERLLPHNAQLEEAVAAHPEQWKQVASFPVERKGAAGRLEVFELQGHQQMPKQAIELDMRHSLERGIRVQSGSGGD